MTQSDDADDARRVRRVVDAIIARRPDGALRLVRRAGWVAVPVESGDHLTRPAMLRIVDLLAADPSARLWAALLEPVRDMPDVLPLGADEEELALLNRRFGFLNVALVATPADAETPLWLLACTTDDYAVALGPPEQVAALVGSGGEAAARDFVAATAEPHWPAATRATLGRVAWVAAHYREAAPGGEVWVPVAATA